MLHSRVLSPSLFGIALGCFLLPWSNISCQGDRVVSLSGIELATGKTVQGKDRIEGSVSPVFTAFVLLMGLVGALMFREEKESQRVWTLVCSIVALIGIILTKFLFERYVTGELVRHGDDPNNPRPVVLVEAAFGYWMTLLSMVVAVIVAFASGSDLASKPVSSGSVGET